MPATTADKAIDFHVYPSVGDDDWRYMFQSAQARSLEMHLLSRPILLDMVNAETYDAAVSTWMARRYPDLPAIPGYQLRGMAIDPHRQGLGVGTMLLDGGVDRCRSQAAGVVWARARISALGFYERHGFETKGPEYTDLTTGLPHIDIVRHLEDDTGRLHPVRSLLS